MTYLGDFNQDLRRLRGLQVDAQPRCRFCRDRFDAAHATTSILNPAIDHPLPACQDCKDEWDEQNYHDWQAEQAYEREFGA